MTGVKPMLIRPIFPFLIGVREIVGRKIVAFTLMKRERKSSSELEGERTKVDLVLHLP